MREVIVTGGAGYIGSHIVQELLDQSFEVHVIDNLQTGFAEFIPAGAQVHLVDVKSFDQIAGVFSQLREPRMAGVIHAAGLKFAGESIKHPTEFYEANTFATLQLMKAMARFRISNLVFSSSSSVYGDHGTSGAVREDSPLNPISPYGRSKYFAEEVIRDAKHPLGINSVSLRYFNVIGSRDGCGVDVSIYNLLPNLYRAVDTKDKVKVFGDTYPTPDGTCIRDYVDVRQLAKAHFDSLKLLFQGVEIPTAINLGSGQGYSVREIISFLDFHVGGNLNIEVTAGREGDPAITLADISVGCEVLGWVPKYSIQESIASGWKAWQNKPELKTH